ncbi:MAG: DUF2851 family protein [Verrucomicrobiota bacterium]|nr:DUF2851 family protein [Verrucomicrobiota bacterium]
MRARSRVRDRPLIALPKIPGELELQARWFAGDCGREYRSVTGDAVEIVQFGTWNRGAGPDFTDAAVRIGDSAIIRGAIEIDLLDRNWELHGHASNPAFDETVLHVFVERSGAEFFSRTSAHRNVPQVQLDLASLSDAGVTSLPLAYAGRCVAPLRELDAARVMSVLEGAAQFRLRHKARRFQQRVAAHGRSEALYQMLADALGYRQNRLPFTLLAQRLPLARLLKNRADAEALLFGVAGFLDAPDLAAMRQPTRSYVRGLWDRWWKMREENARLVLPRAIWKFGGARPLNHPHRRLGALATLVREWKKFEALLRKGERGKIADFLGSLPHDFWSTHYTLAAKSASSASALIGESRVAEIFANVIYPIALADGRDIWPEYRTLRAQLANRPLRTAAARLFATDARQRDFLKSVVGQQGVLQIYEDFCLRDQSDCAACPFPEQVKRW